jgi:hypothetical protein
MLVIENVERMQYEMTKKVKRLVDVTINKQAP